LIKGGANNVQAKKAIGLDYGNPNHLVNYHVNCIVGFGIAIVGL
jgi:hypothetical protein